MAEYQNLTDKIQVPSEWPVQEIGSEISNVAQIAERRFLSGEQVIVSTGNISTQVTRDISGIGYVFRRIQEMPDDSYKIEIILPSNILLISDAERILIPMNADTLKFHSLHLNSLNVDPNRQEIRIGVPNLYKILNMKSIIGDRMYDWILKSTYLNVKIAGVSSVIEQLMANPKPVVCGTRVTENEYKVICFDQIPKPQLRWLKQLGTCIPITVILTLFLLLLCHIFWRRNQLRAHPGQIN